MAVGKDQRRQERRPRVAVEFADADVEAALDALHLADLAWHDCYGPRELEVPPDVLDDVLLLAGGGLAPLIRSLAAAVLDFRDVRMGADARRASS